MSGSHMSTVDTVFEDREVLRSASGAWWLFLLTGLAWLVLSVIVFRFDITSVRSIGILFGALAIAAGANEFLALVVSTIGWKFVHGIMGVAFIVIGLFAFIEPGSAFAALASVIGFYFLFKGVFDIAVAITTKGEFDLWWLQLLAGILEIALAFWVAGNFEQKATLLLVYTGLVALSKGVTELFLAFKLRSLRTYLETV
ncbi:hypothetical protein BH20ACT13_BH20ACT13_22160 [soil metagenome]